MGKIKFIEKFVNNDVLQDVFSDIPKDEHKLFINYFRKAFNREIQRPPRIALIGRTGVGKSSTLNSLFGTKLLVRHTKPATKKPTRVPINKNKKPIKGKKGDLIFFDMPGVGEDIEIDEKYVMVYQDILVDCDVIVWVVEDDGRDLAYDKWFIENFRDNSGLGLASRLVIGINKVDRIHPGNWNNKFNLPSREQEHFINARKVYVMEKIGKVCPGLSIDRIVPYSAKFHYRLQELFGAMLKASPPNRAWVLDNIQSIGSFLDGVDQKILSDPNVTDKIKQLFGAQHVTTR